MHPAEVSSRWMHRQSIIPGQATTSRSASGARGSPTRNTTSAIRRAACSRSSVIHSVVRSCRRADSSAARQIVRLIRISRAPSFSRYICIYVYIHIYVAEVAGTPALMVTRIKGARPIVGTINYSSSSPLRFANSRAGNVAKILRVTRPRVISTEINDTFVYRCRPAKFPRVTNDRICLNKFGGGGLIRSPAALDQHCAEI